MTFLHSFLHSLDQYGNSTLLEEGAHDAPDIMYGVTKLFTLNVLLCYVSWSQLSRMSMLSRHEICIDASAWVDVGSAVVIQR